MDMGLLQPLKQHPTAKAFTSFTTVRRRHCGKRKMADDGYDFFAPQPRPQPRQKNNLFEVVQDAFSPRTIELTGDHRRVKRGSGTSTPANEASGDATSNMAGEGAPPVPVEETMKQYVVKEVSAEMWEGGYAHEMDLISELEGSVYELQSYVEKGLRRRERRW